MNVPHEYALWWELVVVLTIATTTIVAVTAFVERKIASAAWRRMLWQASAAGLVLLLLFELTGVGQVLGECAAALLPQVRDGQAAAAVAQEPGAANPTAVAARTGEANGWTTFGTRQAKSRVSGPWPLPDRGNADRRWQTATDSVHRWELASSSPGDPTVAIEGVDRFGSAPVAEPLDGYAPAGVKNEPDGVLTNRHVGPEAAGQIGPLSATPCAVWPAVVWLAGGLVLAAYVLLGHVLLSVFRWRCRPVADPSILSRVQRLAGRLGVRASVRVVQSPRLKTPVAFGVFAPTVALPSNFAADFTADEQEAVLVHELAHLAAADPAWQLAVHWLCVWLWWQPAVWLLRSRLAAASEAAADEASLVVPGGPQTLASCLVAMGRRLIDTPRLGWLPMTGDGYRSNLGRRVTYLLALDSRKWRMPRRTRAAAVQSVVVFVLVVAMVSCTSWVRPRSVPVQGETTMMQWKITWSRSLAAAGLAILLGSVHGDTAAEDSPRPDDGVAGILVAQADGEVRRDRDREEGERDVRRDGDRDQGPREGDARRDGDRERGEREGETRRDGDRERDGREGEARRDREHEEHEEREEEENPERVLHELNCEREELTDLVRELQHELEELPDDADEEARGIQEEIEGAQHEIRGVEAEMREMVQRHREGDRPRNLEEVLHRLMREREELMQHGRELQGALERNRREGREGAVAELEEELGDVKRRIQGIDRETQEIRREGDERERPRGEGGPREEIERRLHHLRVAAENLRAAGMHDHAQHLMQQAENLARELGPGERDRPRDPRPDGPPRDPHMERPGPEQLERAVREMHGQMQEMRRQMDEMRGVLKELVERERSRDR